MFTRKTILAVATVAALGVTALAPTSASAWGHWGGHFGGGYWGGHWGGWGHRWGGWGWGHRWAGWGYGGWRGRYCAWHGCGGGAYPVSYYGGGYAAPGAYAAPAAYSEPPSGPPPARPGCLAKGYTPDGSVVFTDRCTHEGAVGAADNGPPQDGPPQGRPPSGS